MPPTIAGIVHGQLRFAHQAHFDAFANATSAFELHVATYHEYEHLARALSCSLLIIPEPPLGLPTTLLQWYSLQQAVRYFADRLGAQVHSVVRLRTDIAPLPTLPPPPPLNVLYAYTDRMFYAARVPFTRVFSTIFDQGLALYSNVTSPAAANLSGRGGGVNALDETVLKRMLAGGTTRNGGGCVHPCERRSHRFCPNTWHRIPWLWAPPLDLKCAKLSNGSPFCSETSFSYHVHAHEPECQPLPEAALLGTRAVRTKFRWGMDGMLATWQHLTCNT